MTGATQIGQEDAFFFENEGKGLFGVLHTPETPVGNSGIIFCDPYGEEKHFNHRTFVSFARRLCGEGFYVLRFDYGGNGDSEGEQEETTFLSQLSDIKKAIELMRRRGVTGLGLLGLRLGGTLAALAANSDPGIEFLVLWAPIVKPKEHFDRLFRSGLVAGAWGGGGTKFQGKLAEILESEGLIELQDCSLNHKSYAELSKIDLTDPKLCFNGELLIADVTTDSRKYSRAVKAISDARPAQDDRCEIKVIEQDEFWSPAHVYQKVFPAGLCDETLEWLTRKRRRGQMRDSDAATARS